MLCKAMRTKSWQHNCFIILWRKCMSITSLSGGRKVATLPPDLPVKRLLLTHGEILILASLTYNRQEYLKLDWNNIFVDIKVRNVMGRKEDGKRSKKNNGYTENWSKKCRSEKGNVNEMRTWRWTIIIKSKSKVKSNEGGREKDAKSWKRAVVSLDLTKNSLYHWLLKCAPHILRD